MLIFIVMLQQLISSEIIFQIPDDAMNMVGIVLSVVVFYNNRGTLYTIVMRMTRTRFLLIASPGKAKVINPAASISFIIADANKRV
jgi:hypothetical protein